MSNLPLGGSGLVLEVVSDFHDVRVQDLYYSSQYYTVQVGWFRLSDKWHDDKEWGALSFRAPNYSSYATSLLNRSGMLFNEIMPDEFSSYPCYTNEQNFIQTDGGVYIGVKASDHKLRFSAPAGGSMINYVITNSVISGGQHWYDDLRNMHFWNLNYPGFTAVR